MEKAEFDYKKWVELNIPFDTINSGEAFIIQCSVADTSYYSQYKGYPIVAFSEDHQISIKPKKNFVNESRYAHILSTPRDSVIEKNLSIKILLKTEANRDTTILLNFTYYITNLEKSPRSEGKLVSDEKEGKWIFYTDSSKKIVKEFSEWKQNKRHGKTESYFPNGKISRIETYKQGVLHGESYSYGTPSGKLYTTEIFDNGELVKEINH